MSDIDFIRSINRELYARFMKPTNVYLMDRGNQDKTYGEDPALTYSGGRFDNSPSYTINAYYKTLPNTKLKNTKFGLDEERSLTVMFFNYDFEERGFQKPNIGDRIELEGQLYDITQTNTTNYWGNSAIPMSYACTIIKTRVDSLPKRTNMEDTLYPASELLRDRS
jgi:hypothetical protein